ncbi:PREDICTED: uncharacterized protein LOC107356782 [Acropora digitifera]|uniref:uncharacterized protein LOC107356782 n=1 Tax=Acropora digitifera TaxID=70779 RepID=UPI00077A73F0|nr:PREDICTED: uncharacterized protein LOC107356782 [Acropora digitifera]
MMRLIYGTHHVAIQVVAAMKAIRMINLMEKSNVENRSSSAARFMQSINRPERNNWVSLFPGCHSMGFLEKMVLDAEQLAAINELIPGAAVNTQESFKFRKINYWNQIFYSTSCSKVTKRNSYKVVFVDRDGNLKVGMILYYLKLVLRNAHPYHLAAIQELHPYPEAGIMAGIDVTTLNNNLAGHLKPFCFPSEDDSEMFIHIQDIQSKQVAIGCLTNVLYICTPPNMWEMD